jgi:hypothetical protein
MVCFETKTYNLGKFSMALDRKKWKYFMAIWNILRTFGIFYDHLVYYVFIWYILFRFWSHGPIKIWQLWTRPEHERLLIEKKRRQGRDLAVGRLQRAPVPKKSG